MYWQPEIETLAPEELRALQLTRLRASLAQAARAPFYARRFSELGLNPQDIKSLDDLARLPFTTKSEIGRAHV